MTYHWMAECPDCGQDADVVTAPRRTVKHQKLAPGIGCTVSYWGIQRIWQTTVTRTSGNVVQCCAPGSTRKMRKSLPRNGTVMNEVLVVCPGCNWMNRFGPGMVGGVSKR